MGGNNSFFPWQGSNAEADLQESNDVLYENPHAPPPIKVSELATYIEKLKDKVNGFKNEFQVIW